MRGGWVEVRKRLLFALLVVVALFPAVPPVPAAAVPAGVGCEPMTIASLGHDASGLPRTEHGDTLAPCPGIRPGGALIERRAEGQVERVYCSMGFLVTDGTHVYVTTAGHCTLKEQGVPGPGERVAAHGVPGRFGEVVYQWCEGDSLSDGCGAGRDFALIRIDADKLGYASGSVCAWGMPAGVFGARDENPRELRHFGWGLGVGGVGVGTKSDDLTVQPGNPATQARRSLGRDFSHTRYALGVGAANVGDSGSAVLVTALPNPPSTDPSTVRALGVLTHIAGGYLVIQRLDESLRKAGTDMDRTFTLWQG